MNGDAKGWDLCPHCQREILAHSSLNVGSPGRCETVLVPSLWVNHGILLYLDRDTSSLTEARVAIRSKENINNQYSLMGKRNIGPYSVPSISNLIVQLFQDNLSTFQYTCSVIALVGVFFFSSCVGAKTSTTSSSYCSKVVGEKK